LTAALRSVEPLGEPVSRIEIRHLPRQPSRLGRAFYNFAKADVGVEDREGTSVFFKNDTGAVFHACSCYARGIDMINTAYHYLDLAPKGRDEDRLEFTQA